jgi:hypothetical protein
LAFFLVRRPLPAFICGIAQVIFITHPEYRWLQILLVLWAVHAVSEYKDE